jgi:hypothetical protein
VEEEGQPRPERERGAGKKIMPSALHCANIGSSAALGECLCCGGWVQYTWAGVPLTVSLSLAALSCLQNSGFCGIAAGDFSLASWAGMERWRIRMYSKYVLYGESRVLLSFRTMAGLLSIHSRLAILHCCDDQWAKGLPG